MSEQRTLVRPTRVGVVVSDKMDKTAVVAVETPFKHPRYKKYVRRTKKFMIHDERNECQTGDKVLIVQDRPRSKQKTWRLRRVIDRPVLARGAAPRAESPEVEVLARERVAEKEARHAEKVARLQSEEPSAPSDDSEPTTEPETES
jgi:small subunit ribosomal protein S17